MVTRLALGFVERSWTPTLSGTLYSPGPTATDEDDSGGRMPLPNLGPCKLGLVDSGCSPRLSGMRYDPGAGVLLAPERSRGGRRDTIVNAGCRRCLGSTPASYEPGPGAAALRLTLDESLARPRSENAAAFGMVDSTDTPVGIMRKLAPGPGPPVAIARIPGRAGAVPNTAPEKQRCIRRGVHKSSQNTQRTSALDIGNG